ncbi:type II secretion system F family protein [Magnetospirillum sp. UT-4]|uniref:type II secretion system F family protein n=1 Tax=Magnetospirillum sp. UT-4 TaxID=2681467 RepID=UPI001384C88C|nr:type II secretion system F family protein [Magnetospirillum sp. UT-4]CAA7625893.1 Type II secretion system protein [Magnetospirillum sp. UT-4]
MAAMEILIVTVATLAAFVSVLALGVPLASRDQLAGRLKAVAERRRELSASQRERLGGGRFQPRRHVGLMKAVIARLNLQELLEARDLKLKLARAGYRGNTAAVTFIFSRVALPVVLLVAALLYVYSPAFGDRPATTRLMVALSAFIAGSYVPALWLANLVQRRRQALTRAFPEALDLMVICVEAGQSVEGALIRVTEELGSSSPALAEEMGLAAAELAFLGDRRLAWDNLAERTGLPLFKSLATALVQSEKYGTPVSQALRVLAQETRESRMAAAEKKAAALPAKLTVPMITFFLPVLFLVIAGPAVIQVMQFRAGG